MQHWQQMEETVLCVKSAPQKKKGRRWGADVRRVCGPLTPAGFFILCGFWHLRGQDFFLWWVVWMVFNTESVYFTRWLHQKKTVLHCSRSMNCVFRMHMCLVSQCLHVNQPHQHFKNICGAKEGFYIFSCLLRGNTGDTSSIAFMLHSVSLTWCHP